MAPDRSSFAVGVAAFVIGLAVGLTAGTIDAPQVALPLGNPGHNVATGEWEQVHPLPTADTDAATEALTER